MNLTGLLHQRRSTRHFNPAAAIGREELARLIDTANRAPSSNNAQPWRIMVLTEGKSACIRAQGFLVARFSVY